MHLSTGSLLASLAHEGDEVVAVLVLLETSES